ncbi:hypothetical protein CI610_00504 [invertebrate metagenome]|uniref:Uncharacterized protein n=1 Tax=invertebrate metagenome TaxID=1711999 RepID=A0A2H9TBA9_9ZZZZ
MKNNQFLPLLYDIRLLSPQQFRIVRHVISLHLPEAKLLF